jgi:hypothetical protein
LKYFERKMSMTPLESIYAEIAAGNRENLASTQTLCCGHRARMPKSGSGLGATSA